MDAGMIVNVILMGVYANVPVSMPNAILMHDGCHVCRIDDDGAAYRA